MVKQYFITWHWRTSSSSGCERSPPAGRASTLFLESVLTAARYRQPPSLPTDIQHTLLARLHTSLSLLCWKSSSRQNSLTYSVCDICEYSELLSQRRFYLCPSSAVQAEMRAHVIFSQSRLSLQHEQKKLRILFLFQPITVKMAAQKSWEVAASAGC